MILATISVFVGTIFLELSRDHSWHFPVKIPLAAIEEGPIALSSDVMNDITHVMTQQRWKTVEVIYCATAECSQAGVYKTANAVKMFLADEFPEVTVYDSPTASVRGVSTRTAVELIFN